MNAMQHPHEMPRRFITAAVVIAGLLFAVNGWGQATETASSTEAAEADVGASMDEMPDIDAGAARQAPDSAKQPRRAFRKTRWQARVERIGSARPDAPQEKAVPSAATEVPQQHAEEIMAQEKPLPVAARSDIIISFGPDPRHTQGSQSGNPHESQPGYSAINEGEVTVEARVEDRDAKGQPVAIRAAWNPADPATVEVSPAEGSAVIITVRGMGQSNLTVAGPGFTKDLWISATNQGKAIRVQIFQ